MTTQPADAAPPVPSGRPVVDVDARRTANLERLIADLYEVYDLGAIGHFEHLVEPHPHRPGVTVDVFRVVWPNGRQAQLPYAQLRQWLAGFFVGRNYPRSPSSPR